MREIAFEEKFMGDRAHGVKVSLEISRKLGQQGMYNCMASIKRGNDYRAVVLNGIEQDEERSRKEMLSSSS